MKNTRSCGGGGLSVIFILLAAARLTYSLADRWASCGNWDVKYCKRGTTLLHTLMNTNCKKTCATYEGLLQYFLQCVKEDTCDIKIEVTVTFSGETCSDKNSNCKKWVRYCTKTYQAYMKLNCPDTCGLCAPPCKNHRSTCDSWKRYCTKGSHQAFVKKTCPKTCGVCKAKAIEPITFDRTNCGTTYEPPLGSIVGGQEAPAHKWKWQGAMYVRDAFHCGGSLIKTNLFLTAAHCVDGYQKSTMKIVMGEHDRGTREASEQTFEVEEVEQHSEYYLANSVYNDIALLKLRTHATLNEKVGVVCLPEKGVEPRTDLTCYITGWGRLRYDLRDGATKLMQAKLDIVPVNQCLLLNRELTQPASTRLCGGNKREGTNVSGCNGDSGGPYVCQRKSDNRWVLQGIVSYGSKFCDASKLYTVFTKVPRYIDWISESAGKLNV